MVCEAGGDCSALAPLPAFGGMGFALWGVRIRCVACPLFWGSVMRLILFCFWEVFVVFVVHEGPECC